MAPCHTSKKAIEHFQTDKIKIFSWPGNLSNLNPTENLKAIVKDQL